jgi:RimJ/RimL family protein N-acetyltransferase
VIAAWRYPGRYATYNVDDPSELARDHLAVCEQGALVGYCCFGEPARVGNGEARADTLDVGYGLAPELMGRGTGRRFVHAILEFALERYDARWIRLFILEWNARSRAVAASLGFVCESAITTDEGDFVVMVRLGRPAARRAKARSAVALGHARRVEEYVCWSTA